MFVAEKSATTFGDLPDCSVPWQLSSSCPKKLRISSRFFYIVLMRSIIDTVVMICPIYQVAPVSSVGNAGAGHVLVTTVLISI